MRDSIAWSSLGSVALLTLLASNTAVAQEEEPSEAEEVWQAAVPDDVPPGQGKEYHPAGDDDFEMFPDEAPNMSDDELRAEGVDPCVLNEEGNWVDWLNRKVTSSVCGSARWFDGFFGTQNEWDSRQSTFGRMAVGTYWDEDDGFDPEFRFRAKLELPNMNHRWSAVVGKGDVDEVLDGESIVSPGSDFFDEDSEWLVGFGYNFELGGRTRLSPSIGASFSSGLDPYVRIRYLYQLPFNEDRTQFRLRIVPQWQDSKGFGYTFRTSIDHTLGERFMLRWDVSIKDFEERFEGFSFGTYLNLFHKLNRRNALRYKIGLITQSELDIPHQPQDEGGSIAWRLTVYKEILVVETEVGTTFRHRPEEESREAKLIVGLVFELKFGQ